MRLRTLLPTLALVLAPLAVVTGEPTAALAPPAVSTSTGAQATARVAARAAKPARPDAIIEISNLSDGSGRVRIVVPAVPKGVKRYEVRNRGTGALIKRCSVASMKNGSGARGCYIDIPEGFYSNQGTLVAVGAGNRRSDAIYVPSTDLGDDDGTQEYLFVKGSVRSVARLVQAATAVFKNQAPGCAQDAAVKAGIKQLKKLTTRAALRSKNPYVAAVALVANGIAYYDKKAGFDNRCSAIGDLLKNIARAAKNARSNASGQSFVFAESTWVRPSGPNFCAIYSSGSQRTSRPGSLGGLDEGECKSFWGPMVS